MDFLIRLYISLWLLCIILAIYGYLTEFLYLERTQYNFNIIRILKQLFIGEQNG